MRRTKCFAYDSRDLVWFRRLAREAKKNGRTESQQMLFILRDWYARKRILREIQEEHQSQRFEVKQAAQLKVD